MYKNLSKSKHTVHSPLQLPYRAESYGARGSFLSPILPHRAPLTQHWHFSNSFYPANCGRNPVPLVTQAHDNPHLWLKALSQPICCLVIFVLDFRL